MLEEMCGWVLLINGIFISLFNELGVFYVGMMVKLFGLVLVVVLGGFVVLSVVGIIVWKNFILCCLNLCDLY